MKKEDLEKLKTVLLKEKEKIEAELGQIAAKDPDAKDDYDAVFPDFGSSPDENAQEVTEFDKRKSLEYNLEQRLADINRKLDEIDKGTHGACHNCGGNINPMRLEAVPTASLCISCAKKS
jgi:RNA polymerase-binding transcription factor DksA